MSNLTEKSVHWIGAHPASWEITRIGSLYHTRNTKVSDTDYAPLSVTNRGVFPQLATVAKTDAHDARKLVKKGDFVINSRSDRRNACGVASNDGSVSLINIVLIPKQELHIGYYNWLFRTSQFADEFYKWGHGIVDDLWTTGWQDMKKIPILLPPYHEQQAIASFLDEKCAEIDALVEDIQEEISTLEELKKSIITEAVTKGLNPNVEMLPSGMFGCDYRPAHWKTSKLKFFTYVRARLGWKGLKADEYVETGYPFLSAFNIQNSELSLESVNYISQDRYDESPEIKLKIGDILLVKDGAGIGKCAYVDQLPHPSTVNGSLAVITCFPEVLGKLLYYFFLSTPFQNIIALLKDGMGVPHLFQSDIRSIVFEFPESIQEQCSIINHLEQEISKINAIISNKNKQLKILQEYKTSLIYEYVTGKKEAPQK